MQHTGKRYKNSLRGVSALAFCNTELNDFDALCAKADNELFQKILNSPDHVLHPLLPPPVVQKYNFRSRPHYSVATLRPAAVSRACEYVGSKATSSTNVLYDVSPSSS